MQVGVINSIVSKVGNSALNKKSANGFASLISGSMGSGASLQNVMVKSEASKELSNNELYELRQFLQINNIFDLDNGMELLNESAKSDADMINLIAGQLNVSHEELFQLLNTFYLNFDKSKQNDIPENVSEDDPNAISLEMVLSLFQSITAVQKQYMNIEPNADFRNAMKAIKLFELLSAQHDSLPNQLKLKEFMRNMNEQLERALDGSSTFDRGEFAKKTFRDLAAELKGNQLAGTEKLGEHIAKSLNKTEPIHHQGFIQFQQFTKPEQLSLLSSSGRAVSAEQLYEQFEAILSKSQFMKSGGTQRLFIKLNPEHLGSLRVELIQKDATIIARILTSTSNAKEMMESHLNGLKQAFQTQNIQVERIEISQALAQQERNLNREQHQGQERQQEREEQQEKNSADFTHSFEEALLNTEA
ncbi:flagellar hook-length control protein FliK [Cytobacillus depressus]|uniref:Flagellar hook-length control protein FliK n=1 Tax=Cytobacillus depressus TaxID=1602942 RepID=A0A6L3V7W4_9BACI|nr:flagellar hook-length control protein FliK [Cytobacillus depressus]KAB2337512.1 flagellar hook-length control protein FliK [Cytobacillus depressus]